MHTIIVIAFGFALFGLCVAVGRAFGATGGAAGALAFLPLWFVAAAVNMYVGVASAGYSVVEETPVFLLVFGIPAAAAIWAWRKLR